MKKITKKTISMLAIALSFALISSCKKDEGKLPNIAFKTTAGYTGASGSVAKNTILIIGIEASKSEKKDVLKSFDASKSYDGAAEVSFDSESLSGSDGDNYSKDVSIITRNQTGTETYTFTVINKDGIKNSVSLTMTVI